MRPTTVAEDQAERAARARWQTDQAYRDEFCGDLGAAVAIAKAEARGHTRNHGGNNVQHDNRAAPATPGTDGGAAPSSSTGPGARASLGRPEYIRR